MDTTQEDLIAALVRRLEGRKPLSPRRDDRVEASEREPDTRGERELDTRSELELDTRGELELDVVIELEPSGDQVIELG